METNIHKEIFDLEPSTLISLYSIDLSSKTNSADFYRFHAGENGYDQAISFKGKTYNYFPIRVDGFNYDDSKPPRPRIAFDNTDSFMSLKLKYFDNFLGYRFTRLRTFVKFLDDSNFPNNRNPHSTDRSSFPEEEYVFNKKTTENSSTVEFELSTPIDLEVANVPARDVIYNACRWCYRSTIGCGYSGPPVADKKDNALTANSSNRGEYTQGTTYNAKDVVFIKGKTDSAGSELFPAKWYVCVGTTTDSPLSNKEKWIEDECSRSINGCRMRFGKAHEVSLGLPFGGFPGTENFDF